MYEPFPYFVLSLFPEKNSQTLPAVNSAEFTVMETQLNDPRCCNGDAATKDARIKGHGKYSKEPIVVRYAIISSSDWFSKFPALFTNSHVKILRTNQNWI